MSADKKLRLVLCWHMHQPEYRDMSTGSYRLPWTYLHVIKDYVDMAAHLEANAEAKAVINFAPILLEQIADYAQQVNSFLHAGVTIKDPLLAAFVSPTAPADPDDRWVIIKDCMRANRERQIHRYAHFRKLVEIAERLESDFETLCYLSEQFFFDILMWYHLSWMAETVKISSPRIRHLLDKGGQFTLHERVEVVEVIEELLSTVLFRYKSLAKKGQIELSVTPYAHPIMPLMLDIKSAHQAMPDAPLPELDSYPGGMQRVQWHIEAGLQTFKRFFGAIPVGCWPSEGGICSETLHLLSAAGFKWTASGGNVLHNSLNYSGYDKTDGIHHPFKLEGCEINCFFRDDGLSDLIGFDYSKWDADDAVADLIRHLENIASHGHHADEVISIIMDGENAWEHFPNNGYHFLTALYKRLTKHPDIELVTFSDCLERNLETRTLHHIVAGSWVYGTFSTWIGDSDKNRAWDMLGDAKRCFDQVVAGGKLSKMKLEEAQFQLAVCEGSDWFWWFGDYNPGEAVSDFEQQFRLNLTNLYGILGAESPTYLSLSFTRGSGMPAMGGAMRPGLMENA